jgi:cytochrome c peroxidase
MSLDARTWLLAITFLTVARSASPDAPGCAEPLKLSKSSCAQWHSNILPTILPAARGNVFADRDDAAALGMKIFYDNRFSQAGSGVSCASCHDPEHSFSETKARSHTIKEAARNAPDLINAAWYARSHFWDGKVDNLWSAPLFTFEQDAEMGSSRLHVVHTLAAIYQQRYEKIFGPMPDISEKKRFPDSGRPGTPEFDAMAAEDKLVVNQVYANVGKALEAYVRKLAAGRSPFDDFMAGSEKSLSPAAQRGMAAFTRYGCQTCHSGPLFSDEGFHKLTSKPASGRAQDPGREAGVAFLRNWEFTSNGRFADPTKDAGAPMGAPIEVASNQREAFRTPSLRNVALTPPYGHDGSFATLDQAIDAHAEILPRHMMVAAQDKGDIVEFLRSLSGRPPRAPWNSWPGG